MDQETKNALQQFKEHLERGENLVAIKQFPKHLMEKSGLLRYAAESGETCFCISYNADDGRGKMAVVTLAPILTNPKDNS